MPDASPLRKQYLRLVFWVLGVYFKLYHHLRVEGTENIPRHGPLLVIANHVSLLEPFAGAVALAGQQVLPGVELFTVSKKELFAVPPVAALISSIGMFPIDRERTDMSAMRTLLGLWKQNKMVGIAPEGTRSPTGRLQAFQPVVAKIAISRRVPILPVGALGAEKALPKGALIPRPCPITIRFGPVFELSEFYNGTLTDEQAEQAAWVMRDHVAALLPEWMRELPLPADWVGADEPPAGPREQTVAAPEDRRAPEERAGSPEQRAGSRSNRTGTRKF